MSWVGLAEIATALARTLRARSQRACRIGERVPARAAANKKSKKIAGDKTSRPVFFLSPCGDVWVRWLGVLAEIRSERRLPLALRVYFNLENLVGISSLVTAVVRHGVRQSSAGERLPRLGV